jgi:hypothetical protein
VQLFVRQLLPSPHEMVKPRKLRLSERCIVLGTQPPQHQADGLEFCGRMCPCLALSRSTLFNAAPHCWGFIGRYGVLRGLALIGVYHSVYVWLDAGVPSMRDLYEYLGNILAHSIT